MYSSVFAHETDTALRVRAANPPPPPGPPRHAAAGFWGAVLRAPASGALDAIESVARVAGGDPATAMRAARAGGRLPLLDQAAARERERTAAALGLDDRADPRTFVHGLRESLTPDPATTGSASMAVFQFGAFATQAIVAGAALGLPGGALATGLLAGEQEAWRLRQQGVDPEVARGAGAVRALVTGAAVALPVAGTTLRQSIGLVAAGGPAAFAIEQQGIRSILERADYREIAAHYDPMDLHGLIFSTLVPAGFAVGVHGGRALRRAGVPEDAARRQTEGAVAPAPDAALVPTPPQAAVDAAMTLHIARAVHESAPVRDLSDPVAQMAHRRALDEAEALFE
ncbi:MAG TPA: hypothetical protein VFH17_00850, partial [Coriobacteriia bacterium]|nr:hypothetical protein [Coriobacteriia bacterium]